MRAQRIPDRPALRIQCGGLGSREDPGVARGELDPIMVLAEREPFDVRMGTQQGMRVEGDEAHLAHLGYFEVAQHLPGEVLVNEAAVAEANRFPGDLSLEIAFEVDIHRP